MADPSCPLKAGRCPRTILLFVTLTIAVLAADLLLKYAAFEFVADKPITLVQTPEAIDAAYAVSHDRYVILFDDPTGFFPTQPSVSVVPGLLDLRLTTNTGAVFGLGKGARWIFIVVSVAAVVFIVFMFARSRADAWLLHVALALILAGALGNLYDRVMYAAVRDMLHLFPGVRLWPWIFNIADAVLMIGVGVVLVLTFRAERRRPAPQSVPD